MGRKMIRRYCIWELNRMYGANQQLNEALKEAAEASELPLLSEALEEQVSTNIQIRATLGDIFDALGLEPDPIEDEVAAAFVQQLDRAARTKNKIVKDLELAQVAIAIDHWEAATYTGLVAFLRQALEDEASELVEKIVGYLGVADRHLEALRPSLTELAQDEERHGHEFRSVKDREFRTQLFGYER